MFFAPQSVIAVEDLEEAVPDPSLSVTQCEKNLILEWKTEEDLHDSEHYSSTTTKRFNGFVWVLEDYLTGYLRRAIDHAAERADGNVPLHGWSAGAGPGPPRQVLGSDQGSPEYPSPVLRLTHLVILRLNWSTRKRQRYLKSVEKGIEKSSSRRSLPPLSR